MQWFQAVNRWAGQWSWLDKTMVFFAQDLVWVLLAFLALLWLSGREKNQRAAFFACLSAGVALLIGGRLLSPLVNHTRPFVGHVVHQLIPHAADPSFPSDHATLAFSLAFSILFVSRRLGIAMVVLALLTGVARVYVGVHYPADIAGAIALSFAVSLAVHLLRARLELLPRLCIRIYNRLVSSLPFVPKRSQV